MITLLTVDEAAQQLRVHPQTVRRMIRQGRLPAQRTGTRVFLPQWGIHRFIETNTFQGAS